MNRGVPDSAVNERHSRSQTFSLQSTSKIAGVGFVLRGQPLPHNSNVAQIVEYYVAK